MKALQRSYFGVIRRPVIPHLCFVSELTELTGSPWGNFDRLILWFVIDTLEEVGGGLDVALSPPGRNFCKTRLHFSSEGCWSVFFIFPTTSSEFAPVSATRYPGCVSTHPSFPPQAPEDRRTEREPRLVCSFAAPTLFCLENICWVSVQYGLL